MPLLFSDRQEAHAVPWRRSARSLQCSCCRSIPMSAPRAFFQLGVLPPKPLLLHQLNTDTRGPQRVPSWILPLLPLTRRTISLSLLGAPRPSCLPWLSPPLPSCFATFTLGLLSPSSTPRSCHHTLNSASVTRHDTHLTHDISVEPIWMAWKQNKTNIPGMFHSRKLRSFTEFWQEMSYSSPNICSYFKPKC